MKASTVRAAFVIFLVIPTLSCGGGSSSTAPTTATATTTTPASAWTSEGVRLTEITAGVTGLGIADSTVFQTNSGTWRMFFNVSDGFLRSATSPDGLSWTVDANKPLTVRGSVARFVRADSGHVRVFFACGGCAGGSPDDIYSAVSTNDGATWTVEDGARISAASVGASRLTGMSVVKMSDGRWRGYFAPQGTSPTNPIYSATSADLLNWTLDSGTRLGPGKPLGGGDHPCAILNSNGTISLFYWRGAPDASPVTVSTSTDGLTFTTETKITGLPGSINADPEVVHVGSGLRLYYNSGNDTSGTIYSAINPTGALAQISIR